MVRVLPSPVGGGQLPFIVAYEASYGFSTAAYPSANRAHFYRFRVDRPLTLTTVKYFVGGASGNVDGGIYTSSDGGANLTRVASSGSTAASGTNAIQTLTLTAAYTVVPGIDYYVALAADNNTLTVARASINATYSGVNNRFLEKASSFPLPTSVASLSGTSAAHFLTAQ